MTLIKMAAKKRYSAQEASEIISTWMYKSNDDENSDTSERFSESESENESDLEDTSINFINETAISMITSSSTNDSFHHHTTFSTVASSILEATPITSVAGASKFPNKKRKHKDKIANTTTKSAVPDVQWRIINPDENDERLHHFRFCPSC